ncbi:MAG: DUF2490 domain-containing protein [Saprospiraceae bacterium]|nr:DUF2490 domain-containing protein [Saprospiraceae bacterium]
MNTKVLLILFFFCASFIQNSDAQSDYRVGLLPAINVNKSLGRGWAVNFKYELRQFALQGNYSSSPESAFEYDLSDFIFIASKKVGLNNSLAGGYLFRLRGTTVIHRTIQQFTIVSNYNAFRLAHRISTDQTFEPREPTTFRLRYRLTAELPLNGESVDPGEWYAKISNEYLNSLQDKSYDLEIRLIPLLGYQFTDNNKLEFGPDYRISSFLESSPRSVYWLSVNWFVKL